MQRITIFGRQGCGYCSQAKAVCERYELEFRYIDIHQQGISKADLEKTIGKPVETVPQVFCGQQHIGGYTELMAFLREQGVVEDSPA